MHGIPHVRATGPLALAYGQGVVTATDRAWQLEVERHRAQGTTAAFLGPDAIGWDTFARRALLEDTARRCHRRLDPQTRAWLSAYTRGVNAGLPIGARRAPEFTTAALAPGRWRPWTSLAVWLSAHILFAGFPTKLWRDHVAERLGAEHVGLFHLDGPATAGSNGWLVAGTRTASGAALVAGDPHRFIEDPGVYHQIHLACPEYDVLGLAVPGVPGLPHFGHGRDVAWAITNAMADYQDLYRERLQRRPAGVMALGPDGWEPARSRLETIEVAGAAPVTVEVVETRRGPLVDGDVGDGAGLALRHPPRVTRDLGFAALPMLLAATTVADVGRAADAWVEPVNVMIAADRNGGLLHRVAGRVPVRPVDNALHTVPAWEPGHAWSGWHRPPVAAEVGDVTVMANDRGLSAPLGVEFAPPHRARRIACLLHARTDWTAQATAEVHTDTRLASAAPLLALVATLDGLHGDAAELRDELLAWDRHMSAASTAATGYARLRAAVTHRLADHPALAPLRDTPAVPDVFRPWLAALPRIGYALEALLTTTAFPEIDRAGVVRAALHEVAPAAPFPPWSSVHTLLPWRALPDPPAAAPGLAGDHDCVLSTSSVPGVTDGFARGPAARFVWDLADRSRSRWIVPFGADGVSGATHHADQQDHWRRGDLLPVHDDWTELTAEAP
ncbi:MAG: penicillin acylase family protein [Hamadaea sp.]|nr:penicillin acylase family protein [Hamadaea sp.]